MVYRTFKTDMQHHGTHRSDTELISINHFQPVTPLLAGGPPHLLPRLAISGPISPSFNHLVLIRSNQTSCPGSSTCLCSWTMSPNMSSYDSAVIHDSCKFLTEPCGRRRRAHQVWLCEECGQLGVNKHATSRWPRVPDHMPGEASAGKKCQVRAF